MSLSQETPPESFEQAEREWLARRFTDVGNELDQPSKYPERREMPYKPRFGDIQYFGDPATHSYDPVIATRGWWGFREILPATDPKTGEWVNIA